MEILGLPLVSSIIQERQFFLGYTCLLRNKTPLTFNSTTFGHKLFSHSVHFSWRYARFGENYARISRNQEVNAGWRLVPWIASGIFARDSLPHGTPRNLRLGATDSSLQVVPYPSAYPTTFAGGPTRGTAIYQDAGPWLASGRSVRLCDVKIGQPSAGQSRTIRRHSAIRLHQSRRARHELQHEKSRYSQVM